MTETAKQLVFEQINAQLAACGWRVQNYKTMDLSAARGIALRNVPLKSGHGDYLLVVNGKSLGVIEVKKSIIIRSTGVKASAYHAESLADFPAASLDGRLPFRYESTGAETFFCDERDPDPGPRLVYTFHRPETLAEWITQPDSLRARLACLPPLLTPDLRDFLVEDSADGGKSLGGNDPGASNQAPLSPGKAFTASAFSYRLLKYADARCVLFLVDRGSLGHQVATEFQQFIMPDTGRKFTELYKVQHLTSNSLDPMSRIIICTIQRLYAIMRGKELSGEADELSAYEISAADPLPDRDIYNPGLPIEMFDFVVADEYSQSIYNHWRQVLEYFDAFHLGFDRPNPLAPKGVLVWEVARGGPQKFFEF